MSRELRQGSYGGLSDMSGAGIAHIQQFMGQNPQAQWQAALQQQQYDIGTPLTYIPPVTKKETGMLQELSKDLKQFVISHKAVIYSIALALLVDHLFFEGKFRGRLHEMMNKLLTKVEDKINTGLTKKD